MKDSKYSGGDEKVKLPWEAELEVKDLISPIKVRRIRLIQTTGTVLLLLALGVFGWWLFFAPPSGERS